LLSLRLLLLSTLFPYTTLFRSIIGIRGVRVYHAGDTDAIPEMKGLKPDVALLPVSGTYVMTAEEAAQAAKMVEPKLAIPMHYGVIVGSEQDAQKFKQLATVEVQ